MPLPLLHVDLCPRYVARLPDVVVVPFVATLVGVTVGWLIVTLDSGLRLQLRLICYVDLI